MKPLRTRKRRRGRRDRAGESGRAQSNSSDRCIHHLFEAQVARTLDAVAVAVKLEGEPLTCRKLHKSSGRLATGELRRGIHVHDAGGLRGRARAAP